MSPDKYTREILESMVQQHITLAAAFDRANQPNWARRFRDMANAHQDRLDQITDAVRPDPQSIEAANPPESA
jgi:hypothetical protein